VVCRTARPQAQLLRFHLDSAGQWQLDAARRAGGRGAWLCRQAQCQEAKSTGRFFKGQAPRIRELLAALDPAIKTGDLTVKTGDGGIND
jgi:predicted RNA-binding protein YlxR (DUF448 family)